jgi:hypothetical protein
VTGHLQAALSHLGAACEIGLAHFASTSHPNVAAKLREYASLLGQLGLQHEAAAVARVATRSDVRAVRLLVHGSAIFVGVGDALMMDLGDIDEGGEAP